MALVIDENSKITLRFFLQTIVFLSALGGAFYALKADVQTIQSDSKNFAMKADLQTVQSDTKYQAIDIQDTKSQIKEMQRMVAQETTERSLILQQLARMEAQMKAQQDLMVAVAEGIGVNSNSQRARRK